MDEILKFIGGMMILASIALTMMQYMHGQSTAGGALSGLAGVLTVGLGLVLPALAGGGETVTLRVTPTAAGVAPASVTVPRLTAACFSTREPPRLERHLPDGRVQILTLRPVPAPTNDDEVLTLITRPTCPERVRED